MAEKANCAYSLQYSKAEIARNFMDEEYYAEGMVVYGVFVINSS